MITLGASSDEQYKLHDSSISGLHALSKSLREEEKGRRREEDSRYSERRTAEAVQVAFKDLMIHGILQFALRIAFRCVLHRCGSQDIRR